jgi:PAS domain S-box-containing protein
MMETLPDTAAARPRVDAKHEQETSYRMLFLHHPTPMWFMDEVTLAFLEVNEAAIRRYGYTRDEFSRMTMLDLRLPEEAPRLRSPGQRSRNAQDWASSGLPDMWRHRTQDGTLIDVGIVRSEVVFRGRQAILAMVYDATAHAHGASTLRNSSEELDRQVQERTSPLAQAHAMLQAEVVERARAEAALRDREERLSLALEAGQMATWEWDVQLGTLQWSTVREPLHGFARDSLPGTYEAFLDVIHAEDRVWFRQAVRDAFECGTAFAAEFRILSPDGSVHWMVGKGRVLSDETGQPRRMLGVSMEVTMRKRAEAEALQRQREAEVLAQLAQTLNTSLELDMVLQRVTVGAQELCGSERGLIMLREPGSESLVSRYQVGFPQMPYMNLRIEPGKGMGGWVVATGRPLRTADYAADTRISKDYMHYIRTDGRLAILTVPIIIGSRVEGVIYVSNPASRPFTEQHEVVLLRLADYAATAIRNAQLYHAAQDELGRRKAAESQLQTSLKEKEVLLREIHHRVKNNLQIVSSLLNLQLRASEDPHLQGLMQDCRQRVQAMALIHEALYQADDLSQVPFEIYVRRLATQLLRAYAVAPRRIQLNICADPLTLDIDKAAPCALIFHELFSNALKHAFPTGRSGTIEVALRCTPRRLTMSVRDNGVGVPAALDWRHANTLGLKLISMLTEQLRGSLRLDRTGGTTFTLRIPLR